MGRTDSNFHKKLVSGTFGEEFVRVLLEQGGIRCWKNPEASDKWDLRAEMPDGFQFTLEVKYDQMEAKTGNVALEYHNVKQNKPSGILATTSDLWAFVLAIPLTAWICRTGDLRYWFENHSCCREIACGGDNNSSMKLYRRKELFDAIFRRIDDLAPWEMMPLLRTLLLDRNSGIAA